MANSPGGRASVASAVAILLIALLLCAEIARLTIADRMADTHLQLASRLAPASPDTLASNAMAGVGKAAATGGNPSADTLRELRELSVVAPLRPEPFLVEAAMSERSGDYQRAETLLLAARALNPRSTAARYLLADVWLQQGRVVSALSEMAVLSRLMPGAYLQLVPSLAQYAKTPGARGNLLRMLSQHPELKIPLLSTLAADPDNTELVLVLAGNQTISSDSGAKAWQSRLVNALIDRAQYGRAYELWRRFSDVDSGPKLLLFNGDFRAESAPPPFNWLFSSSADGIAEAANGKLHVLYYGREDTVLASELLLLPPGAYHFETPMSGEFAPGSLLWTLTCDRAGSTLIAFSASTSAANFTIPASGCNAQWLRLQGKSQDMPQQSEVEIGPARIQSL